MKRRLIKLRLKEIIRGVVKEEVRVIQREKFPEFDTDFLQELSERLAITVMGSDVSVIKFKIVMRAKMPSYASGAHGAHEGLKKGWHVIAVQRPETFTSLQHVAEIIAHEMTHALQTHDGRLYTGYDHWVWEGKRFEKDSSYHERPWEQEAEANEKLADQILEQMKSENKIQLSRSEKMRKKMYGDAPTMGDLEGLSREEMLTIVQKSKEGVPNEELFALIEKYKNA